MHLANALYAEDKGISMTGLSVYVQGGHTYNFRNPDSQENELRVFDHKVKSFTLDLARVVFTKELAPKEVGFKLKLSIGETIKFIHSAGHCSIYEIVGLFPCKFTLKTISYGGLR